jgi:carbon-monoxide dehydrogenase medium subunit
LKAPPFRYARPGSLPEALTLLQHDDAIPLAGGQSLMPALNMRLSAPALLVDLAALEALRGITLEPGALRLGALTRHRDLLDSALVRTHVPLLAEAARHIAHVAIRNRGTLGGSLAYADPAAELPCCITALGGTVLVAGLDGTRAIPAEAFFTGLLQTALRPGELIIAVNIPTQAGCHWGFAELARREGDYAIAGLAATATLAEGRVATARFVYLGCVDRAQPAATLADAVRGQAWPLAYRPAFAEAVAQDLSPSGQPGWRAGTKLHLAQVLTRRVMAAMAPV